MKRSIKPMKPTKIAIDFDGTCATHPLSHEYPYIGNDIGAAPVLRELVDNGHLLVLFTMRGNQKDNGISSLEMAVGWFRDNNIPLYGIQNTPDQHEWTDSPKADCRLIIDDITLGAPLTWDLTRSERPFIDWFVVRKMLVGLGYIK